MKFIWALLAMSLVAGAVPSTSFRTSHPETLAYTAAPRPVSKIKLPSQDQLRHQGGWLVDRQGRVVILHGVNAVWKHAPYTPPDSLEGFTAADADWLAAHGFNAMRLGVLFAGVMPQQGVIDHSYLDRIDRVVKLLAARGIYVMIDFHQDLFGEAYAGEGFPEWAHPAETGGLIRAGFPIGYVTPRVNEAFDGLWNNTNNLQSAYRDAWIAVAARWRDADHLMGYDLINEPWSGSAWPVCALPGGCADFEQDKLQTMYEHVLAGIRGVDADNIVWLEPQVLFDFGAHSHLGTQPIDDAQLGLSWHNYCIAQTLMQTYGAKDSTTCAKMEQRVYRNADVVATRLGAASMLSEFGASNDAIATARVATQADENLVGWMYWSYKNWGDPTTQAQGTGAQSMFDDDRDLNTARLDKLAALERPYPQAIAGVPLAYAFEASSKRFAFRYSTTLASGEPAPAGTVTTIYVPTLHYPNGYSVEIDSGHVISAINASLLEVVADRNARTVSLKISGAPIQEALLVSGKRLPAQAGP
ncbi:cellulase family glycosylhydrolase [Nevskia ramosa]|uniref:cellulase family glycosylhydrolase n=1 Tax=Nevskia ramosa TaxID=64002 RepID=UPI003D0ADAE1